MKNVLLYISFCLFICGGLYLHWPQEDYIAIFEDQIPMHIDIIANEVLQEESPLEEDNSLIEHDIDVVVLEPVEPEENTNQSVVLEKVTQDNYTLIMKDAIAKIAVLQSQIDSIKSVLAKVPVGDEQKEELINNVVSQDEVATGEEGLQEEEIIPNTVVCDEQEEDNESQDSNIKTAEVEVKKVCPSGVLFLGPRYNHSLVEQEAKKYVFAVSFHHALAYESFNECKQVVPLSDLLFGKFRMSDIFLLSRLSNDSKLYLSQDPNVEDPRFGHRREEQYLAFMAHLDVEIAAEWREDRADAGFFYRFCPFASKTECTLGFNLPIKSRLHIMDLELGDGNLFTSGFTPSERQAVHQEFYKYFIDPLDFFRRAVVEPKGLLFRERQRKIGIGDISFFACADISQYFESVDGFQFGVDLIVPSGNKPTGCEVWEIVLGNGGAFELGISSNFLMKTSRSYFNPSIAIAGKFPFTCNCVKRIPKQKSFKGKERILVNEVDDLITPMFSAYYTDSFEEFDSKVAAFADEAFCTKTKFGNQFFLSVGNYFYNVFKTSFRLSFFYDFIYKGIDKIKSICADGIFNTCLLEQKTKRKAHQISWNLAYVSKKGIEVNIGSTHMLDGQTAPKKHEVFFSIVAAF